MSENHVEVTVQHVTPELSEEMEWEGFDRLIAGRPPAVKFAERGDSVLGTVIRGYTRQKTKFGTNEPEYWDDGSPKLEPVLELMTSEGARTLFLSSWRLQEAIGTALAAARVRGPRRGGTLMVRYISDEIAKPGAAPAKVYEAGYEPPTPLQALDAERGITPVLTAPPVAGLPAGQQEAPPF